MGSGGPRRGAPRCALQEHLELAILFRKLATLRTDVPVGTVDDLQWRGPTPEFERVAQQLGGPVCGIGRGESASS